MVGSAGEGQFKESGFQVNVHVIEAQRLAGAELHPYVIVQVADEKKTTKVIEETVACPYFDEVKCLFPSKVHFIFMQKVCQFYRKKNW